MSTDPIKRQNILISDEYRTLTGKKLKQKRINSDFTIKDIGLMLNIPVRTVIGMENGTVTNIDYYVEFAKAVGYALESLTDLGIPLTPINALPEDRSDNIKLTKLVRKKIVNSNFLKTPRTLAEIVAQLVSSDNTLTNDKNLSKKLSGIMRNLTEDHTVDIASKLGRRNLYQLPLGNELKEDVEPFISMASEFTQKYEKRSVKSKKDR